MVHTLTKDKGYAAEMTILPKISNFAPFRNHHCAKFYTNAESNVDMTNVFQFLALLHNKWLFCPKMSNLGHIKPWTIAYILYKVMDYPCANLYTISSLSPCHTYTFSHGVRTATSKNYEDVVWTHGTALGLFQTCNKRDADAGELTWTPSHGVRYELF